MKQLRIIKYLSGKINAVRSEAYGFSIFKSERISILKGKTATLYKQYPIPFYSLPIIIILSAILISNYITPPGYWSTDTYVSEKKQSMFSALSANLFSEGADRNVSKSKVLSPRGKGTVSQGSPAKQVFSKDSRDEPGLIGELSVKDTIEFRNKDRYTILTLMSNLMSGYYQNTGKLPVLYINKSGEVLGTQASHVVYLYNDNENKTNAVGMHLGNGEDKYKLVRTNNCTENDSDMSVIAFYIKGFSIIMCDESGGEEVLWIPQ